MTTYNRQRQSPLTTTLATTLTTTLATTLATTSAKDNKPLKSLNHKCFKRDLGIMRCGGNNQFWQYFKRIKAL
jgi:hypothetical protein